MAASKKEIKLVTSEVVFFEDSHQYFLGEKELQGVTSTLIPKAYPGTYMGIDQETLENAAARGTLMHKVIEGYLNDGTYYEGLPELDNFIKVMADNNLTCLATEYIVSDNENFASAIDLVMQNKKKEICLVDLKRTSELHFEEVALQLSIYKRWFERMNAGIKVKHIYVLRLRDNECDFVELHPVSDDFLDALVAAYLNALPFVPSMYYGNLPSELVKAEKQISLMVAQQKAIDARMSKLKEGLYTLMEQYNVKSWKGSNVTITRVLPSVSVSLDSKKVKENYLEVYNACVKETKRKGSLKITVKEGE